MRRLRAGLLSVVLVVGLMGAAPSATAKTDWFPQPSAAEIADAEPGEVFKTRTVFYRLAGIPLPLRTVQLMFRTTDQQGRPSAGVTSVVQPLLALGPRRAVSYQSFYDSLNPADQPSRVIAGNQRFPGGAIVNVETLLIAPLLLQGFTVIIPDTQGQTANFAAGREYGAVTLDSIRASLATAATGLSARTKVGMIGYSGGSIATGWAAQLQPDYAPELSGNLVGAAEGGVLVAPAHNLRYIEGSTIWAGVAPMAVAGIGRAFDVDFEPYLNERGSTLLQDIQDDSIAEVLGAYPGLTWADLVKPEFVNPNSIPEFVTSVNAVNRGAADSPGIPMFIGQAANGILEGTPAGPAGIGPGDGVMIAGDVRTLARQFCEDGTTVQYRQYDLLSHFTAVAVWLPEALAWLTTRFTSIPAPDNCASIAPGNPLDLEVLAR
ncbi:secretory lipase [Aeromicrobium marinum DSM 15272]|uniref:Secretory lipase n=1 Tax=Aeromicrobium marinum DSM 15272 TaxID=585531 RepID=E2S9B4_9ACTN|nr:lipase family protein [Aeromicrobium marinum]EFQ83838.1 secretory lipase [Aeromicrobium marinum DSM 15272]